ncbi:hypothetical protein [Spiroplasma cantharicola]|uniref:DNA polymerase III subunit delta n=1 Tax=Spiroplasma cantharicola TaxID=362837 RepID=A0A0M4KDQ4_9MOLU|nr:hypothetical protein [Spiroplasma cantharicola]ALD65920.1 DNA polymerase III subunit delta' [Spiroplasma cantharicola]
MKKVEVFSIVNELIKNKKLYHSIIISNENQTNLDEISTEILRQIYCLNNSFENDGCDWCLKVVNKNNLNIFYIGDSISKISKDDIKELIIKFSSSGIEDNKNKVYILANGENLSESASNALLKFLEEPPKNTYALILTKDRNKILSTIKSRCKLFSIENEIIKEKFDSQIIKFFLNKEKKKLLKYLISFKKMERSEIIADLNIAFENSIDLNIKFLQELLLDTINEIKETNYINLILENLFIKMYEVI